MKIKVFIYFQKEQKHKTVQNFEKLLRNQDAEVAISSAMRYGHVKHTELEDI